MSLIHLQNVSRIVSKPYLTEMDLIMMQKELLLSRIAPVVRLLLRRLLLRLLCCLGCGRQRRGQQDHT